jgi:acyl carrier protein
MAQDLTHIESFIRNFERQLDNPSSAPITPDALFRDLPGWTSLQSLVVIVSFDEDYGVTISSDELQNAQTIGDLFMLVRSKQGV